MPRDTSPTTKTIFAVLELDGYRCGLGEHDDTRIATAKRDSDGQFHSVKASSEDEAVAESVGVELGNG